MVTNPWWSQDFRTPPGREFAKEFSPALNNIINFLVGAPIGLGLPGWVDLLGGSGCLRTAASRAGSLPRSCSTEPQLQLQPYHQVACRPLAVSMGNAIKSVKSVLEKMKLQPLPSEKEVRLGGWWMDGEAHFGTA